MQTLLRQLGFAADDRIVIIHPDDIGMCQATLPAYAELVEAGLVSSATTMAPCPWFPAVAAYCRAHPEVDMGVHLTLASEWDVYRWGPISTRDPASGLVDDEGYFDHGPRQVWERADVHAVEVEIRAQLDRALTAGIDVTHLDSHMDTLVHPRLVGAYARLAQERQLPALIVGLGRQQFLERGLDPQVADEAGRIADELDAAGLLLFADLRMPPLDDASDRLDVCKQIIDTLVPGLTLLRIHPAHDTPELRAMAPDWRCRVADYETFLNPDLHTYIRQAGVHVVGYRALRDQLREQPAGS